MKKIPIRQIRTDPDKPLNYERFKIRTVQEILDGKILQQELHRHDFFFILLLQNGSGSHDIDFISYQVLDKSIFFLRPGQVHQLTLNPVCKGFLMEFSYEFYHPKSQISSQRLRKASNKNYCKLDSDRFDKLQEILSHIYQEYSTGEDGYLDIIKANLEIFFIEFLRQSKSILTISPAVSSYTHDRFEEFLELLEKHITIKKQVAEYCDLMNLSLYQLNGITKISIGKSPSELINGQIILEAKRFLLATPNQIKDIADFLGYEDVSYFIRFFKKHTGYSPEAFRNNPR